VNKVMLSDIELRGFELLLYFERLRGALVAQRFPIDSLTFVMTTEQIKSLPNIPANFVSCTRGTVFGFNFVVLDTL